MKIEIDGKHVEVKKGAKVFDALDTIKINPETVLVRRKKQLIPHDEPLEDKDVLELITVISGG